MASCHETYPPSEVTVQRDGGVATIVVSGELDLATAPQLSATVAEHSDASLLVLDLNAVTFIDSTGVRVLIEADRACAGSGSRLAVLARDGPVRRVLDLCEARRPPGAGHRASVPRRPARRRSDDAANAQGPRRLTRIDTPSCAGTSGRRQFGEAHALARCRDAYQARSRRAPARRQARGSRVLLRGRHAARAHAHQGRAGVGRGWSSAWRPARRQVGASMRQSRRPGA